MHRDTDDDDDDYPTITANPPAVTMPNQAKSNKPSAGKQGPGRSAIEDVVAREYTIHLHKRVRSV